MSQESTAYSIQSKLKNPAPETQVLLVTWWYWPCYQYVEWYVHKYIIS